MSLQSNDIQETGSGLDNDGVMFSASSDSELLALSSAMTAFNVDGDFSSFDVISKVVVLYI